MADRPILFSAPMIRALMEGRKSQTRRIIVPPKPFAPGDDISVQIAAGTIKPKFAVGDRLWVREAWAPPFACVPGPISDIPRDRDELFFRAYTYGAAEPFIAWRSPLHMPRWASRITLLVADVRVQRLQEISEADAIAEGVGPWRDPDITPHVASFADLWIQIHGSCAWAGNPWVCAITFRTILANIDAPECAVAA